MCPKQLRKNNFRNGKDELTSPTNTSPGRMGVVKVRKTIGTTSTISESTSVDFSEILKKKGLTKRKRQDLEMAKNWRKFASRSISLTE